MVIEPLSEMTEAEFRRLVVGYTSDEVYALSVEEGDDALAFRFVLSRLDQPFEKRWPFNAGLFGWYRSLASLGLSFAAVEDAEMVGLVIAGTSEWNKMVSVWELHVSEQRRGSGIGRALLGAVESEAASRGYRAVSCETQNTNVPAIRFYRRVGYSPQAVDLSFYSNEDVKRGEVSLFMRKAVGLG